MTEICDHIAVRNYVIISTASLPQKLENLGVSFLLKIISNLSGVILWRWMVQILWRQNILVYERNRPREASCSRYITGNERDNTDCPALHLARQIGKQLIEAAGKQTNNVGWTRGEGRCHIWRCDSVKAISRQGGVKTKNPSGLMMDPRQLGRPPDWAHRAH